MTDFLFLGSKITVDGDFSLEIKNRLLLERKAMTNLDSILKNRDVTLPTKVCIPVITYRCESWTLEKEMATHSSILAWKIPWTEEPGRLQSMRSQRVGHN